MDKVFDIDYMFDTAFPFEHFLKFINGEYFAKSCTLQNVDETEIATFINNFSWVTIELRNKHFSVHVDIKLDSGELKVCTDVQLAPWKEKFEKSANTFFVVSSHPTHTYAEITNAVWRDVWTKANKHLALLKKKQRVFTGILNELKKEEEDAWLKQQINKYSNALNEANTQVHFWQNVRV